MRHWIAALLRRWAEGIDPPLNREMEIKSTFPFKAEYEWKEGFRSS